MIQEVEISKLHPHEDNPRKEIGNITELTESVKKNGILQNLVIVPATGYRHGEFWILAGARRFEAAKTAGLKTVPCEVRDNLSRAEQIEIMLSENMQRHELTFLEETQGVQM